MNQNNSEYGHFLGRDNFHFLNVYSFLQFRLRERALLVGALFVMLIGLFLFLPWGPGSPEIQGKLEIINTDGISAS